MQQVKSRNIWKTKGGAMRWDYNSIGKYREIVACKRVKCVWRKTRWNVQRGRMNTDSEFIGSGFYILGILW